MHDEPERIDRLWENTHFMLSELKSMGYDTGNSNTPIIPLLIGDMTLTFKMWKRLAEEGVFINPVVPQAVPPTGTMIRCSFMATHTKSQLEMALDKFEKSGKELNII